MPRPRRCGHRLAFAWGGAASPAMCGVKLDCACASPWHCPPHIRSLRGAASMGDAGPNAGLGGLPKLRGQRLSHGVYLQRVGWGWGRAGAPSPFCLPAAPEAPPWPHGTGGGGWQDGAEGDAAKPPHGDGEQDGTRGRPSGGWAGQRAAPSGFASPLPPATSLPPALGLASRAGPWHSAEGLAGGRAASPLPPSSRGVKNSALVMNI